MTTCADLVGAARRHLDGGGQPQLNLLGSTVSDVATIMPFAYALGSISEGSYLAVDLEVMYVWSVDVAAKTAVVRRGMLGSTPTSHTSDSMVYVNPRFTDWEIFNALNTDLLALSSPANGLYQIRTIDLTITSGVEGYDFPTEGFISLADVRWQDLGIAKDWPEITDATVNQQLPAGTFPSGTALFLNGALPPAGQTVRVRYRAQFDTFTSLTDDISVSGLPGSCWDIPPLGAAITVMSSRPIRRADPTSQGDTRRADEVHVGDLLSAPSALRALRARRISEESARLGQTWPARSRPQVVL